MPLLQTPRCRHSRQLFSPKFARQCATALVWPKLNVSVITLDHTQVYTYKSCVTLASSSGEELVINCQLRWHAACRVSQVNMDSAFFSKIRTSATRGCPADDCSHLDLVDSRCCWHVKVDNVQRQQVQCFTRRHLLTARYRSVSLATCPVRALHTPKTTAPSYLRWLPPAVHLAAG